MSMKVKREVGKSPNVSNSSISRPTYKILFVAILLLSTISVYFFQPREVCESEIHLNELNTLLWREGYTHYKRVAIGYNSCLDLIVRGTSLLSKLTIPSAAEDNTKVGKALRQFQDNFRHSFEHGGALERYIGNKEACHRILDAAKSLRDKSYHIGGNAALMGIQMAGLGTNVLLGGSLGVESKKILPARSWYQFSKGDIKLLDNLSSDEIHLIMEFPKDEAWNGLKSPRANRFIIHCDDTNSRLLPVESFHEELPYFAPDAVVLAGLHMLEREGEKFVRGRIGDLVTQVKLISGAVPVHLEMASVDGDALVQLLLDEMLPRVNSVGMNEQEIAHMYYVLKGVAQDKRDVSLFKKPQVALIEEAILLLFRHARASAHSATALSGKKAPGARALGRVHFHALQYHVVARNLSSDWADGKVSVGAGSHITSLKSCDVDYYASKVPFIYHHFDGKFQVMFDDTLLAGFETEKKIRITENSVKSVYQWVEDGIEFSLSPVAVCRNPTKTVGLGDAISSTGLLYHQFQSRR